MIPATPISPLTPGTQSTVNTNMSGAASTEAPLDPEALAAFRAAVREGEPEDDLLDQALVGPEDGGTDASAEEPVEEDLSAEGALVQGLATKTDQNGQVGQQATGMRDGITAQTEGQGAVASDKLAPPPGGAAAIDLPGTTVSAKQALLIPSTQTGAAQATLAAPALATDRPDLRATPGPLATEDVITEGRARAPETPTLPRETSLLPQGAASLRADIRSASLVDSSQSGQPQAAPDADLLAGLNEMARRAPLPRTDTTSQPSAANSPQVASPVVGATPPVPTLNDPKFVDTASDMRVEISLGSGSAETTRLEATRPLPAAELPSAILAKLREMIAGPGPTPPGRTEVTLSPAELGRVTFVIGHEDGLVSLQVLAERPETLELIRRHADLLHRTASDGPVKLTLGQDGTASQDPATGENGHSGQAQGRTGPDGADPNQPDAQTYRAKRAPAGDRLLDLRL